MAKKYERKTVKRQSYNAVQVAIRWYEQRGWTHVGWRCVHPFTDQATWLISFRRSVKVG